jgi:hypothetical protein
MDYLYGARIGTCGTADALFRINDVGFFDLSGNGVYRAKTSTLGAADASFSYLVNRTSLCSTALFPGLVSRIPYDFRTPFVGGVQSLIRHPKTGDGAYIHTLFTETAAIHVNLDLFFLRQKLYGVGGTHPKAKLTANARLFVVSDTSSEILRNRYRRMQRNFPTFRRTDSFRKIIRKMGSKKGIGSVFLGSLTQYLNHHSVKHLLSPFYMNISREIRIIPAIPRLETLSQ